MTTNDSPKEHRTMFDRFLSTRTGLAFVMSPFVALFAGNVAFLVHLTGAF